MVTKAVEWIDGKIVRGSTYTNAQLKQILAVIPLSVNVVKKERFLESCLKDPKIDSRMIFDYHGAQVIELRPPQGYRIIDACMSGSLAQKFSPSRIMDETSGESSCSSYNSNTRELGLDFDSDFTIDIYKLG